MPISSSTKKLIRSLQVKKYRKEEQLFVVEGAKGVEELLRSEFEVTLVAATEVFIDQADHLLKKRKVEVVEASEKELESAGSLQTNQAAIAIARMKPNVAPVLMQNETVLILDDIRDPGNLGTIIRTADWYGIKNIVASLETADLYNSKTISATMGSFTRVHVYYALLSEFLPKADRVYGAFLDGADVHKVDFVEGGYIVIGNESNGISDEVSKCVTDRVSIPRYGNAESLNAGIATAVILDNMRRSKK